MQQTIVSEKIKSMKQSEKKQDHRMNTPKGVIPSRKNVYWGLPGPMLCKENKKTHIMKKDAVNIGFVKLLSITVERLSGRGFEKGLLPIFSWIMSWFAYSLTLLGSARPNEDLYRAAYYKYGQHDDNGRSGRKADDREIFFHSDSSFLPLFSSQSRVTVSIQVSRVIPLCFMMVTSSEIWLSKTSPRIAVILPSSIVTKLFAPGEELMSPSSSRIRHAFWAVLGFTPSRADSILLDGISSPSCMAPDAMPRLIYIMIC